MNIITHTMTKNSPFVGCILFAILLTFGTTFGTAHALSCLNPTEMITDYVSDERYAIARVVAGDVETEGPEHTQVVTVTENLKGTTNDSVSFIYDDTWQYLCAGGPADVGAEMIYITSNNTVTQVIALDTPLYESLISALTDTPTQPEPTNEEEIKRTLMFQIIDLLQQMISLLQDESLSPAIEPEPEASPEALIGLDADEAIVFAAANDLLFRIVEIDGQPQPATKDYRPGRINAVVENDVVVGYTIEGEEIATEDTGPHDDLIGMTLDETEAYAKANDISFRLGRIDNEFLPVTLDYRPGRITAEIEEGVVVGYSVE
jgi:hypothetical protein